MEACQGGSEREKLNPSSTSAPIPSVANFWRGLLRSFICHLMQFHYVVLLLDLVDADRDF